MSDFKIINDPVFGFIKVPRGLLLDLVKHPIVQRLTRIKQLGMASVVYPGAQHTRFQHSVGAFHLMSETLSSLSQKGIFLFDSEMEAVEAAILLHDVGHGPFSHVLESTIIQGISHEDISLMMMERINQEMQGALTLAINIFKGDSPKAFLHQLISSQLDMDRLDYLRRDCFFTGVNEGNIGSDRIIKILNVADDRLVAEEKGIYSIENYLVSRRLMYWQVYLHKTVVAYEKMLVNTLLRVKELYARGRRLFASPALSYFLENNVTREDFLNDPSVLDRYILLDDSDIWSALKVWASDEDVVLSTLASGIINRRIFKVKVSDEPFDEATVKKVEEHIMASLGIERHDLHYFMWSNVLRKDMYSANDEEITILMKDGTLRSISEASDMFNNRILAHKTQKYYLCYQRC